MKEKAGTNTSLLERLAEIPDPRIEKKCAHPLINIMAIAICAVIGGADDWNTIESFGKAKKAWFETFLDLENGIPSHDTFRRLFSILSEKTFREFFTSWVREVARANARNHAEIQ